MIPETREQKWVMWAPVPRFPGIPSGEVASWRRSPYFLAGTRLIKNRLFAKLGKLMGAINLPGKGLTRRNDFFKIIATYN